MLLELNCSQRPATTTPISATISRVSTNLWMATLYIARHEMNVVNVSCADTIENTFLVKLSLALDVSEAST